MWMLAAFAALGAGLLLTSLTEDDDEATVAETDDIPPETETGPETGVIIDFDGSALLQGSAGDDSLADDPDYALEPDIINFLGGDDTASLDPAAGSADITVNGGDGDDVLSTTAIGVVLNGDGGDDTLSGVGSVALSGGDGDDTLTADLSAQLNDAVGTADGGDGNDQINIISEIGAPNPDYSSVFASGGNGNDDFIVDLHLSEFQPAGPNDATAPEIHSHSGVIIRDFTPGEDTLLIEVTPDPDEEDRTLENVEIAGSGDQILLSFAATADAPQTTTSIRLDGVTGLTMDDFAVVMA
ncbi:hypothetical protein LCL97_23500 [Seohaeicola saemankumensis]|nr:hypothetical protein [Seohaeicola saemankumensis]MCA0873808.1 hypothetical protein [Seohaeicola saemankumensis]